MNKSVLGIDLGTSSVKILQKFQSGKIAKSRASYEEISPEGWWKAICHALGQLELDKVEGISLSSQVGTYIVNGRDVISWNDSAGSEELKAIKETYSQEVFVKEISMPHPNIISYPIPRLKYIKGHFERIDSVCQPKDFICKHLTGEWVTDPYSWRGLANLEKKEYSSYFLKELGIDLKILPKMLDYTDLVGYTKEIQLAENRLAAGIPVFVGLNDYFASLLGMGVQKEGDLFDISGTSEHVGVIQKELDMETELVCGPYLNGNVQYGVTASSGASIKFGMRIYEDLQIDLDTMKKTNPPVFLPYLKGERAPIWNPDARGVYFGIEEGCTREMLAYAAMEGVVFSLYHIYETMGKPTANSMKVSGGAAVIPALNQLKAEMFDLPVDVLEENDTSALGAALIAAQKIGWYVNFSEATQKNCIVSRRILPSKNHREWMLGRYEIYKELYPALQLQYEKLKELKT